MGSKCIFLVQIQKLKIQGNAEASTLMKDVTGESDGGITQLCKRKRPLNFPCNFTRCVRESSILVRLHGSYMEYASVSVSRQVPCMLLQLNPELLTLACSYHACAILKAAVGM